MGSICSPGVGMIDMESEWGGFMAKVRAIQLLGDTWSIRPMLYERDWVCMTGGVLLKSMPRSKDGEVSER